MAALRAFKTDAIAPRYMPGQGPCPQRRPLTIQCGLCNGPHAEEIAALRAKGATRTNLARRFAIPINPMKWHLESHVGTPALRLLSSHALEFYILTAVRREMATSARWDEIEGKIWTCTEHKTDDSGKPYVVVLNAQAMAVLDSMKELQAVNAIKSDFVFDLRVSPHNGPRSRTCLGASAPSQFLTDKMNRDHRWKAKDGRDITVHGFRDTFGSWARENEFSEVVIEMCLGHKTDDETRGAYRQQASLRGPRGLLMDAWGAYCDQSEPLPSVVLPFRQQEIAS
jgi:integrase